MGDGHGGDSATGAERRPPPCSSDAMNSHSVVSRVGPAEHLSRHGYGGLSIGAHRPDRDRRRIGRRREHQTPQGVGRAY